MVKYPSGKIRSKGKGRGKGYILSGAESPRLSIVG